MATNDYISLTGSNFVLFPKDESLYPTDELGINIDVNIPDWGGVQNSQIIGNYNNQGWGLFLENGQKENYSICIVDCGNNQLLKFNNDCGYNLQRSLPTTSITAQTVDELGNLYLFDESNSTVYVFNPYGIETNQYVIPYAGSVNVIKVYNNELYVLVEGIGVFNYHQNTLTGLSHPIHNNFVILSDNSIQTVITNKCTGVYRNCDDDYFHIHGLNLYKNNIPFFYIGSGVNSMAIDPEDNIVIVYKNKRILKIKPNGVKIFDKLFHQITSRKNMSNDGCAVDTQYNKANISFTKILTENGVEYFTWVLYEEGGYVLLVDGNGVMTNCFPISKWIDNESYDIDVSKIDFCYSGDFTSNYALKENCVETDRSFLKLRIVTENKCNGSREVHEISHDVTDLTGIQNIQFTYNRGEIKLILNGVVVGSITTQGSIYYDLNNKIPIIVGADSGRFTALKKEEGIGDAVYLKAVIKNLRIYNTNEIPVVTDRDVLNTSEVSMELPLVTRNNFTEKIDKFFLMRPSGFKSSRMDLDVYDSGLSSLSQDDLEEVLPAEVEIDNINHRVTKRMKNLIEI